LSFPLNLSEASHPPSQLVRKVAHSERRAAAVRAARLASLPLPAPSPQPVRVSLPFILRAGARWYRFCCVVRARTVPDIFDRTPLKTLGADAVDHPSQESAALGCSAVEEGALRFSLHFTLTETIPCHTHMYSQAAHLPRRP
jgi:hypothetical protein